MTHYHSGTRFTHPMAACAPTVDYFSRLPPELVLKVIVYVGVEGVCQCLVVSRRWYEVLSDMEPYWRRACAQIGLPEYHVSELRPHYPSFKALVFAARKQKMSIRATPPRVVCLSEGYPVTVRYACQYANGRTVVGTVYRDFKPCEIVVERIDRTTVTRTNAFVPRFLRIAENRVIWGQCDSTFLVCVTASGIWTGYDLREDRCVFSWRGEPLYDSDATIGCCGTCFLVCTAKLICFRGSEDDSYWDLRLLRLGRDSAHQSSRVMRFRVPTGRTDITPRRANCGMKRVCLVPSPTHSRHHQGFCQSHTVLIQWANSIVAYNLQSKGVSFLTLSRHPFLHFTVPCHHLEEAVVRNLGLNTTFCLSSDRQLIGLIFRAALHVWDLRSGEKLSSVEVALDKCSYEQARLIALGHIYSVIGLEFNDTLLVVATHTGEVVLRCSRFAQKYGRMFPPHIEFLCVVSEDWLSSVSCPCSAAMPAIVYWNKTNRSMEGIAFGSQSTGWAEGQEAPHTGKRKRRWWGSWRRK